MSTLTKAFSYFLPLLLAFLLLTFQPFVAFLPQIVALCSLTLILILIFSHRLCLPLLVFIVNLIVMFSGHLSSPFFFLIYFLLFSLSFQNHPALNLIYSLITMLFYASFLDSLSATVTLFSLLLITPLTYFISMGQELQKRTSSTLTQDETDFLLWISLRLKTSLTEILSLSDNSHTRHLVKKLLKDSEKLSRSIDQNSDEN